MTVSKDENCNLFTGIQDGCKDVIAAQLALGKEVLNFCGDSAGAAMGMLGRSGGLFESDCDCDIPEPCWMPVKVCEVTCELCKDTTGVVRLVVTNQDYRPHKYLIQAAGAGAALANVDPSTAVTLGPKERRVFTVGIKAPASTEETDIVLWVRGCRDYYVRVTVITGKRHRCCHEIAVDDTPDYVVHWYDHFYCPRPCPGTLGHKTKTG